jgi:hypothetical protein
VIFYIDKKYKIHSDSINISKLQTLLAFSNVKNKCFTKFDYKVLINIL